MREAVTIGALLCAFVLSAPRPGLASPLARVEGVVQDGAGAVVPRAVVTLLTPRQIIRGSASTDEAGRFLFEDVPPGSYVLQVSARGFAERRLLLEVRAGETTPLSLALDVRPMESQVTVTSTLGTAGGTGTAFHAVNVVEEGDIRERAGAVLAEVAREETGLHLQRTSPTIAGVYVRGLAGNKVNVFLDGVRYSTSAARGGINTFFNLIEPTSLQAVEILRGPDSAQYGSDAIGGSVQVVSRIPSFSATGEPALHGTAETYFNSADASFGSSVASTYSARSFSATVNLSARRVNTLRPGGGIDSHSALTRFLGLPSRPGRLTDTGFTQYGGTMRLHWAPTQVSQLVAFYTRGQQDGGRRYDQLVGGDGNLVADLRNLMLDLAYVKYDRFRLGWWDQFTAIYSVNSQREERVNQGGSGNPRATIQHDFERNTVHGAQVQAGKQWRPGHHMVAGLEFYHERMNSPSFGFNPVTRTARTRRPRIPNGSLYRSGGLFLQNVSEIVPDRLRVSGSVRYSAASYRARASDSPVVNGRRLWTDESERFSNVSFRGGVVATVNPSLHLYASAGRGFRAPHMTDLGTFGLTGSGYEVAAPDLRGLGATVGTTAGSDAVSTGHPVVQVEPETSLSTEWGARLRHRGHSTDLAFFVNEIYGSIEKLALILPPGAVGLDLAGQTIVAQNANGAVFVGAAANPVLARTNFGDTRIFGLEHNALLRLRPDLTVRTLFTYLHAKDKETGVPPNIEGGTPASDGYLKIRYSPGGGRFWVEPYIHAAARQSRISSLALEDRRTGGGRSRTSIRNFFYNGATARGLVGPGADGIAGTADDRLLATGETLAQVQDRVLGTGVDSAPLFSAVPGYVTFNVRFGFRVRERHDVMVHFSNIGDRNYRGVSWGVDAPGRSIGVRYRARW